MSRKGEKSDRDWTPRCDVLIVDPRGRTVATAMRGVAAWTAGCYVEAFNDETRSAGGRHRAVVGRTSRRTRR